MANKINIVITAEDKASKPIRGVADELVGASEKSGKFSQALSGLGRIAGIATAAVGTAGLAGAVFGLKQGFEFNSQVEQAQTKLMAFMKDGDKVAKTLAWVKSEAALTQFSFTDLADATAQLTPVAKTSGHSLEDLVRQAQILAALNPEQGLSGAMFSLREALSGDWMSIMDRFNIPRTRINQLKAEGVPAMEIISRTLKEMGIDYSLVAKQGQTVSARWEQITDKLRMMAGQAAKPIFDRVSRELGALGQVDYTGLGDRLAGIVSGSITAFEQFIPRVIEVGRQIGEYLGPKFQGLWETVSTKIIPIFQDLWHNVIEPFIPVLGQGLVWAIGAVIDIAKLLLDGIGFVYKAFQDGNPIVLGLAGVFGTLAAAMAFNSVFTALTAGFATLTTVTIPAVMASFGGLAALIASPIVMPAIVVGAAIASLALVQDAANKARQAIDESMEAGKKELQTSKDLMALARRQYDAGKISEKEFRRLVGIAANATGTTYSPGGRTLVGEHGPEIVNMPQGAQVIPAYRSRERTSSGGGGHTVIIQNMNVNNGDNPRRIFEEIGFALELAS